MKKWTLLAFLVIFTVVLSACGSSGSNDSDDAASAGQDDANVSNEIVIKATTFEFDQPEYRIKKGETVRIVLENEKGVHGLEVKDLNLKLDNKTTSQVITPTKTGEFPFVCTIMCGPGHADMTAKLIVEE
jgi:cytochrome c oxidase subunit 2